MGNGDSLESTLIFDGIRGFVMFGLLAVLVIAVGAATWELTTEIGGEYFAMYVLEPTDFGASKRDPSTLNALVGSENRRQIINGSDAPVLLAAVSAERTAVGQVTIGAPGPALATLVATDASLVPTMPKDGA